jgi:hypothetical protein
MLSTFAQALMSAEADAICGAPYGEPRRDDVEAVVPVDALHYPWPQRDR